MITMAIQQQTFSTNPYNIVDQSCGNVHADRLVFDSWRCNVSLSCIQLCNSSCFHTDIVSVSYRWTITACVILCVLMLIGMAIHVGESIAMYSS